MIDIIAICKDGLGLFDWYNKRQENEKKQREEKEEQAIIDDLRRSSRALKGNCLTAEIGSERDRVYSRMVNNGKLVRTHVGYILPEAFAFGYGRFASRFC